MTPAFEILKSATQTAHDYLEQISYVQPLMSQQLTIAQYRNLIEKNWLVFQSLEENLNEYINQQNNTALFPFLSARCPHLKKDLTHLPKLDFEQISVNAFSFEKMEIAHFIGVLYVLEGSRLGGKVVAKALRKNANLVQIPVFHFYAQEGVDIRRRWLAFLQMAAPILSTEAATARAVVGAKAMFAHFITVFEK